LLPAACPDSRSASRELTIGDGPATSSGAGPSIGGSTTGVSREQVALVAQGAGASDRTVWRWLAQVEQSGSSARAQFTLDAEAASGPPAPSLRTLQRAVHEALSRVSADRPERHRGVRPWRTSPTPTGKVKLTEVATPSVPLTRCSPLPQVQADELPRREQPKLE
jgi:hypothetical protein